MNIPTPEEFKKEQAERDRKEIETMHKCLIRNISFYMVDRILIFNCPVRPSENFNKAVEMTKATMLENGWSLDIRNLQVQWDTADSRITHQFILTEYESPQPGLNRQATVGEPRNPTTPGPTNGLSSLHRSTFCADTLGLNLPNTPRPSLAAS